ncbi:hypothetical protein HAX54_030330 [Datura stramonium]|uniref:Uncharacterized protein n=1 Tax=Datura stramonium TaxID=4076 RepID=A0ABS8V7K0_DATST|nr:hypothetical protein [Datura stramonium]
MCLVFTLVTERPVNVGVEEEVDYSPRHDPKGLDVTKTKEHEGLDGLVLSISEYNACIDNILSHMYDIQMLHLRMSEVIEELLKQLNIDYPLSEHSRALCRVRPNFEESFDDDDANDDEQA